MTEKLAHRIIRLYPRAWRERYEQEMLALLEQWGTIVLVGVFGDLLDVLARGVHSQSSQGHGPMALGPRQ